ncbi:MAG: amidohydrolase family protein, partial [Planctomycetota bacterium]
MHARESGDLLIAGDLLHDPMLAPERGWLRVAGGVIAERGFGEAPRVNEPTPLGGRGRLVSPAFVDGHIHLPQVDSAGCDGMRLLDWLDRVIFPAEAWWGRGQHLAMTRTCVKRMVREGTAGFAGYCTSHAETSGAALRWIARETNVRYVAGRVAMDRNAPGELTEEDRLRQRMGAPTSPVLASMDDRVRHAISANPRFAVSCTEELLAEVGWRKRDDPGLFVQTHLAESSDELRAVRELFPNAADYTEVYERAGLLGPRTVLAHCCHLGEREWEAIARTDSVIAHCPT